MDTKRFVQALGTYKATLEGTPGSDDTAADTAVNLVMNLIMKAGGAFMLRRVPTPGKPLVY